MKRIFALLLFLLIIFSPIQVVANESDPLIQSIEASKDLIISTEIEIDHEIARETYTPMTQEEIDELLGKDPYLGQTSWLGSKISNDT